MLRDRWLRGLDPIAILDVASVSEVRQRVRELGAAHGLDDVATTALATVASELAHNHLAHARRGMIGLRAVEHDGAAGLEVVAADQGDGMADPRGALGGGGGARGGLGIGLSGVFELSDEVDVDSRAGEGTCVWARKFARRPAARRRQVAILGRAVAGERVSGDDAGFARAADGALVVALADGLGHGPEARRAAIEAIEEVLATPTASVDRLLRGAHQRLHATRGAVMTIASISPSGELLTASVGNATTQISGLRATRRFGGQSWVLGQGAKAGAIPVEQAEVAPRDLVILFSDGLSSRVGLEGLDDVSNEPPIVVAQALLARFGKSHDDVMVLVAR